MSFCNLQNFSVTGNFHNKKCIVLSLTSFGTLRYDRVIRSIEIFNFLTLINNSGTTGFSFLLFIRSAIISSKTINTFRFLP